MCGLCVWGVSTEGQVRSGRHLCVCISGVACVSPAWTQLSCYLPSPGLQEEKGTKVLVTLCTLFLLTLSCKTQESRS